MAVEVQHDAVRALHVVGTRSGDAGQADSYVAFIDNLAGSNADVLGIIGRLLAEHSKDRHHLQLELDELRSTISGLQTDRTANQAPKAATPQLKRPRLDRETQIRSIYASGLFDIDWYCAQDPSASHDPIGHYVEQGVRQGLDPHPLFDTKWYAMTYRETSDEAWNPLAHYIIKGAAAGCHPHPLFHTDWYVTQYPEVMHAELTPLAHYLLEGADLGYDPNPMFDTDWYADQYADRIPAGMNPLTHFVVRGAEEDCNPSPLFDVAAYRSRNPEAATINPLTHYFTGGSEWRIPESSHILRAEIQDAREDL